MELALHCLEHALVDSVKMVPLLFVIYVAIEALEIKFGNRMGTAMAKAGKAGPVIGAVAGIIPQCGVSVVGTALYTQRLVTIGTLFAVYLATSDEAIPVILSQPDAAGLLVPLIATKLVIAIVVGYALDIAFHKRNRRVLEHGHDYAHGSDSPEHHHETAFEEKGCCGHESAGEHQGFTARGLLLHPLVHTLKVWVFIFLTSFVLALAFELVGQDTIAAALEGQTLLQPILAALVGLIPNCAASVAVTEFYLQGVITFGAAIAGLCASGGLGVLVLLKEDDRREALAIIGGLFAVSVAAGLAVQALGIGA